MTGSFSIILKGQMLPDIYLFDVIVVEDNLAKSFVVGNVVVNAKDRKNMKSYVQGHDCMHGMSNCIARQCMSILNAIFEVID